MNKISLADFLESKGVKKNEVYLDYQDYIEEKQKTIAPTSCPIRKTLPNGSF
jgi:hypothetical protein